MGGKMGRVAPLLILLLSLLSRGASEGVHYCSFGCLCSDQNWEVTCPSAMSVIPHDLPPAMTKLVISNNSVHAVESILSHYSRLDHIDLSRNKITVIKRRSFESLSDLTFLDLSGNMLTDLDPDTFYGAVSLRDLDLSSNALEEVHYNLFKYNSNLKTLDLSSNRLTTLPGAVFQPVKSLQVLNLGDNQFKSVPKSALAFAVHLYTLNMNENPLSDLTSNSFANMNKLQKLSLRGCQIDGFAPGLFDPLVQLHSLDVSDNRVAALSNGVFANAIKLETLTIGKNSFSRIDGSTFSALTSLKSLDITGCRLGAARPFTIAEDAFSNNMVLAEVKISGCPNLKSLPKNLFKFAPDLETVNLHGNGLESIDFELIDWRLVKKVDITGNNFECHCGLRSFNEALKKESVRKKFTLPLFCKQSDGSWVDFCARSAEDKIKEFCSEGGSGGSASGSSNPAEETWLERNWWIWIVVAVLAVAVAASFVFLILKRFNFRDRGRVHRHPRRKPKKKGSISKADIVVKPNEVGEAESGRYISVPSVESHQHADELEEEEGVYEEIPGHFPDIKLTEL